MSRLLRFPKKSFVETGQRCWYTGTNAKRKGEWEHGRALIAEDDPDIRDGVRIPLTTLLLYTEILRGHKYDTPEQEADYLNKIDAKARQIKQLSDNLFEYALVTRDTVAVLDPPAHF